jgi:hypothetical protein
MKHAATHSQTGLPVAKSTLLILIVGTALLIGCSDTTSPLEGPYLVQIEIRDPVSCTLGEKINIAIGVTVNKTVYDITENGQVVWRTVDSLGVTIHQQKYGGPDSIGFAWDTDTSFLVTPVREGDRVQLTTAATATGRGIWLIGVEVTFLDSLWRYVPCDTCTERFRTVWSKYSSITVK